MLIQPINAAAAGQGAVTRPARAADVPAPSPGAPALDESALRKMVAAGNEALRAASSTVQFNVEQESGKTVVMVVDQATHEVIRQFPSEEMIAIGHEIERLQGLLMRGKA